MSAFHFEYLRHRLDFIRPGGTSRGVLNHKDSYFIIGRDEQGGIRRLGECGLLKGLSPDPLADYEQWLDDICKRLNNGEAVEPSEFTDYPSIRFALEMLASNPFDRHFESDFTRGDASIPINGLIWMGTAEFMREQIAAKLDAGFSCLKLKIGAIEFETEMEILRSIRREFSSDRLELRVDANGAFDPDSAMVKLQQLAGLDIHSIEQPIRAGQWDEMAELCANSSLDIALDEELIGTHDPEVKARMLTHIRPQYIILKPSLLGGWQASDEWVQAAESREIGWWATSALESNVGLNAIAQWCHHRKPGYIHGLGTGSLYHNNIPSPLSLEGERMFFRSEGKWNLKLIDHA